MSQSDTVEKLLGEIFSQAADRHGTSSDDIRNWYRATETKLSLLYSNTYAEREVRLEKLASAHAAVIAKILKNPLSKQIVSTREIRTLTEDFGEILQLINNDLETGGLSFMDIAIFHQLADFGRKVFRTNQKQDNAFIPDHLFQLVEMLHKNFSTYRETIQGLQVQA